MIFGALVILFIGLGLAFLIVPVLRKPGGQDSLGREQQNIRIAREKKQLLDEQLEEQQMTRDEYDAAMADLEASLAIDLERQQALDSNHEAGKWAIWVFIVVVPVLSVYMYFQLGEYHVIENPELATARAATQQSPHGSGGGPAPTMGEIVDRLTEHLRSNTEDVQGWFMLGKTYMSLREYDKAVTAFQRTHDLTKSNPTVMLALADSLAMTRNGNMQGEPESLVKQALGISPNELTGLWLAGLAAEQGNRNREAYDHWMKLLPMLRDDPQSAGEVKSLLTRLKEKEPGLPELDFSGNRPLPSIAAGPDMSDLPAAGGGLRVSITLADHFALQVEPNDLLFVYAKAASGPPMPLAAKRLKASDLPAQVTLSDSDAMMPQMAMSQFDRIIVGARISKSGNPVGQAGDLYQESQPLEHKTFGGVVELNISQIKQ
jgi:cytochrome c-type biogenesis protein CcmH